MKNGELSCAFFVSSLLIILQLIARMHGTTEGTIRDMRESGWREIKKIKTGAVLIWEKRKGHAHIGFFIGTNKAISNSTTRGYPVTHHFTYGATKGKPKRKITHIFWHHALK